MMAPELVGRASEIPVVESLLVLGDPGIGKSALVEAASRRAAASASQPATVLTGPHHRVAAEPVLTRPGRADDRGMVRVRLQRHPLCATAGLVWSGDLPRQLQQVLFDTADGIPS